jgi:excinuclease ABC subunit B
MERAPSSGIEAELEERLAELEAEGKLLEAQRLRSARVRPRDDARGRLLQRHRELLAHLDGPRARRAAADAARLLPEDFAARRRRVARQTVPQIGGMYEGDRSRKETLVDYGFRLPSALDNRPLRSRSSSSGSASSRLRLGDAGPVRAAASRGGEVVEQIIRPTGLIDPEVEVKPTKGQIDDLLRRDPRARASGRARAGHDADQEDGRGPDRLPARARRQGALPALRGRHARAHRDPARLRLGEFDVLVGINLLREGLDLPEVSLVAILDADKEGFLRSARRR